MGGRGGTSGITAVKREPEKKSRFSLSKKRETAAQNANKPSTKKNSGKVAATGPKAQQSYIDWVKKQVGVDLSKARETTFDNRAGFNIDTRKLTPSQMAAVQNLSRKYKDSYEVSFEDNGSHRKYIRVRRKK